MKKRFILILLFFWGCVSVPEGISTVNDFDINRYMGKWYEIARLDHSFERGLVKVNAEYSFMEGGGVKVVNMGYDPVKKEWKKATGKAYLAGGTGRGQLKVSFFGPFYGAYNIIDLDKENYRYALVCGNNRSYLWVLARSPEPDMSIVKKLVGKAAQSGFDTDALIYVQQK